MCQKGSCAEGRVAVPTARLCKARFEVKYLPVLGPPNLYTVIQEHPVTLIMWLLWSQTLNRINVGANKHMKQIDVADLDCIYLSYDEPQQEEFWVKIKNMVPWAKRVSNIRGSDAAHKAAARASDTERFVLVDGDNIPDPAFFNQTLDFPTPEYEQAVFRWRARNHVNGLMYGNGGLSSWTREYVNNMKTHENTDGRTETQVEFCFDPLYWAMNDCYSNTYPNGSPFHAWRAGFREGVKMCLQRGRRPTLEEFKTQVLRNLDNLTIWHNVGTDVEHVSGALPAHGKAHT